MPIELINNIIKKNQEKMFYNKSYKKRNYYFRKRMFRNS